MQATGNLLDALHRLVLVYRSALLHQSKPDAKNKVPYLARLRVKQGSHCDILDALRKKDGARATMLMRSHVRESAEDLMQVLPETIKDCDERSAAQRATNSKAWETARLFLFRPC